MKIKSILFLALFIAAFFSACKKGTTKNDATNEKTEKQMPTYYLLLNDGNKTDTFNINLSNGSKTPRNYTFIDTNTCSINNLKKDSVGGLQVNTNSGIEKVNFFFFLPTDSIRLSKITLGNYQVEKGNGISGLYEPFCGNNFKYGCYNRTGRIGISYQTSSDSYESIANSDLITTWNKITNISYAGRQYSADLGGLGALYNIEGEFKVTMNSNVNSTTKTFTGSYKTQALFSIN